MIRVKVNIQGHDVYISLSEYVSQYCQTPPIGWQDYIKEVVNEGLGIHNEKYHVEYLAKMNLREYEYVKVRILYVKLSRIYNKMLEDDILRYFAHLFGLRYFERTKYPLDINHPDLDHLLKTKLVFRSLYLRSVLPEDEQFSIMDLLPFTNGMNAIRQELIFALKW